MTTTTTTTMVGGGGGVFTKKLHITVLAVIINSQKVPSPTAHCLKQPHTLEECEKERERHIIIFKVHIMSLERKDNYFASSSVAVCL